MSGSSREALIVDFKGFEEEYFRYKVKVYQMAQLPPLMKKHGQNLFLGGLDGVYVYFHNDMEGMSIYLDISPSVRSEL